jgi:nucleoid-associated protein YgaU
MLVRLSQLPQQLYNEGVRRARSGDLGAAVETLNAAAALAPNTAEPRVVLGKVYAQQGHYDQAVATWKHALAIDPDNQKARAGILAAEALGQSIQVAASRTLAFGRFLTAIGLIVAVLVGLGLSLGWQALNATAESAELPTAVPATGAPVATPAPILPLDRIREALNTDQLRAYHLEAQPAGLGVRLIGTVPNQALKTLAEQQVRRVEGVALVDSVDLRVVPELLVESVRAALAGDPATSQFGLVVEAAGADGVALHGTVPSAELKRHIETFVLAVPDIHFVDSSAVTVVPPPLADKVRAALGADPALAALSIQVQQQDHSILLRGTVPQLDLKVRAEALTRNVAQVELVDSSGLAIVPPSVVEYEVRPGDTLRSIAERVYGDSGRWRDLYEANRDLIPAPNVLRSGIRLRVP